MLLGGWCLNEQEGTKCCCSPACWSWSRSAAGHDSVGQSCSSAKTARERETASEKAKSMVSGVGGEAHATLSEVGTSACKEQAEKASNKFLYLTHERCSHRINSVVQICHTA